MRNESQKSCTRCSLIQVSLWRYFQGGTTIGMWYGMCCGHDPLFFQVSRRSLAYQITINAPLMYPHFQFLEIYCIFSLVFGQNFSFQAQNFRLFAPKAPNFSRKTRSLNPPFGNPCGTYPPKNGECPPPPGYFHQSL